ncbi:protein of unknown function [Pseudorhizobium banfieldiae]|uniref:Uncharacterized protein n=1 Tax=Pseudorhizobium banfieldiae TaxID=1125847 RepID=L0NHF1_9HYPH|nr:protein of unknown function [Pseudorhizobium banfieldiae]
MWSPMNRLASGRSSLIIAFLHGLQRALQARLRAIAQRDEGFSELLASGLHPQTRIVADTVDRAEDAVDGGQHRIDARDRFPQAPVMMNEFRAVLAGDLAKVGDLAVTPADIEEAADIQSGLLLRGLDAGAIAIAAVALALLLLRHGSNPSRFRGLSPFDGGTIFNLIISGKIKVDDACQVLEPLALADLFTV